jgi:hypothetical protein
MWCKQCGQDVPGVPSLEAGEFSCPRCDHALASPFGRSAADEAGLSRSDGKAAETAGKAAALGSPYDAWELNEQLQHIGRLLEPGGKREGKTAKGEQRVAKEVTNLRLDAAHAGPSACHIRPPARQLAPRAVSAPASAPVVEGRSGLSGLTWAALCLGVMALACGGILLGWSIYTGRQELWKVGTPVALAGQAALLVGLVLQLERLWRDSRHAAAKLETVDERLHDLKTTTTLLTTTHGPSGAFYAHLADGAGPQLLLNDLKGQLDLLAMRLGQAER